MAKTMLGTQIGSDGRAYPQRTGLVAPVANVQFSRYAQQNVTTFPRAYILNQPNLRADEVHISFGRFTDGADAINYLCGARVYPGGLGNDGSWAASGSYNTGGREPVWVTPCDVPAVIPWGGMALQALIEFYGASGKPASTCNLEMVIRALQYERN